MRAIFYLLASLVLVTVAQASYITQPGVSCVGKSLGTVYTANGDDTCSFTSVAGTGDVVGPALSVDNEVALFSGTTGKAIKRATGTGLLHGTSGVASFSTLVNADVSATADIARTKTLAGTAYRILTNDASGVMSENPPITASRAVASDSNGRLTASATTATELGFISGLTSAIQTQLNLLAPKASPAFTTQVTFGNYHLEPCETDTGNSGTSKTLDLSTCAVQKSTLTGSVTYTLSNPVTGGTYLIKIIQGASSYTVTWPITVKWSGGTAPTITVTNAKTDLVNLYWDGTSYYGSFTQNY